MTKSDCLFCNCKRNPTEVILFENKTAVVRLDHAPVAPGHMQVLPKDHYVNISDIPDSVWSDMFECINMAQAIPGKTILKKYYEAMLKDAYQPEFDRFVKKVLASKYLDKIPDAFTVGINDGKAAGRFIDHCHIHIIPRYWGDLEHPEGGIRVIFGDGSY